MPQNPENLTCVWDSGVCCGYAILVERAWGLERDRFGFNSGSATNYVTLSKLASSFGPHFPHIKEEEHNS